MSGANFLGHLNLTSGMKGISVPAIVVGSHVVNTQRFICYTSGPQLILLQPTSEMRELKDECTTACGRT